MYRVETNITKGTKETKVGAERFDDKEITQYHQSPVTCFPLSLKYTYAKPSCLWPPPKAKVLILKDLPVKDLLAE
jgi:hypothetical protein